LKAEKSELIFETKQVKKELTDNLELTWRPSLRFYKDPEIYMGVCLQVKEKLETENPANTLPITSTKLFFRLLRNLQI
jgi:hypothetical protein